MARLSPFLTNGQLDRQIRMTDGHELVEMIPTLYREYMISFNSQFPESRYRIFRIMRSRLSNISNRSYVASTIIRINC